MTPSTNVGNRKQNIRLTCVSMLLAPLLTQIHENQGDAECINLLRHRGERTNKLGDFRKIKRTISMCDRSPSPIVLPQVLQLKQECNDTKVIGSILAPCGFPDRLRFCLSFTLMLGYTPATQSSLGIRLKKFSSAICFYNPKKVTFPLSTSEICCYLLHCTHLSCWLEIVSSHAKAFHSVIWLFDHSEYINSKPLEVKAQVSQSSIPEQNLFLQIEPRFLGFSVQS